MANPRGRNGGRGRGASRGGGSFSDRGRAARPASSSRTSRSSRGGGYGNGGYSGGGGGGGNGPLIAVIGGGAVVVIVLVVILATRGGDEPAMVNGTQRPPANTANTTPGEKPLVPLTAAEQKQIQDLMTEFVPMEKKARKLADSGMRAHQAQRYDEAQDDWHEAARLLDEMIRRSNDLFGRIGEDRVAKFAPRQYEHTGDWPMLKMQFMKSMK